jgi:hypothetical protein
LFSDMGKAPRSAALWPFRKINVRPYSLRG